MRVLVIGSGGREHALAWKLAQSAMVTHISTLPGNAGTHGFTQRIAGNPLDIGLIADLASNEGFDLTIVGPESPLIAGIADEFTRRGLPVFGPSKEAAQMEGSKSFAKNLMLENGIPTGTCEVFSDSASAIKYVDHVAARSRSPIVVKADGEAAGKGVFVCPTRDEAACAVESIIDKRLFGASGNKVLIEEYLRGPEATFMCFVDGETFAPMIPSQDHKRAYDNDKGPNTGGMGAYAPVPAVDGAMVERIIDTIVKPTLQALKKRGILYRGVLYFGLALTRQGPKVIEYNARFGDPETQVVLPLLQSDLAEIALAVARGRLDEIQVNWYNRKAVCVVMASGGYPGDYQKGKVISGLDASDDPNTFVFHAGTEIRNGNAVTAGGRVLGVTATGSSYDNCIRRAYARVKTIHFENAHYRSDIGAKLTCREK